MGSIFSTLRFSSRVLLLCFLLSVTLVMVAVPICSDLQAEDRPANVHERSYCDEQQNFCVILKTPDQFYVSQEGMFSIVLRDPNQYVFSLQDLKVDLWMNMGRHGHGSSPLKIVKKSDHEFFISKAWFVMRGEWLIRIRVQQEAAGIDFKLNVPVSVLP
jgi:hypothetical protein